MKITEEGVLRLAHLARLSLSKDETARVAVQLDAILSYMANLNALETAEVEPMSHALALSNVFRTDETGPSLTSDAALANAPDHDGSHFRVPKILGV